MSHVVDRAGERRQKQPTVLPLSSNRRMRSRAPLRQCRLLLRLGVPVLNERDRRGAAQQFRVDQKAPVGGDVVLRSLLDVHAAADEHAPVTSSDESRDFRVALFRQARVELAGAQCRFQRG